MSIYIYAHLNSVFANDIDYLFDRIEKGVKEKTLSDMPSLQYPPHITLSASFDEKSINLKELYQNLDKVFSAPFTGPSRAKMSLSYQIHAINLEWKRMSSAIENLQKKYPSIPWVTEGYHITLAHNGDEKTMEKVAKMIPKIDKDIVQMEITCPCYTIKVWRVISNEFAKCFADAKTWELLWSRRISRM